MNNEKIAPGGIEPPSRAPKARMRSLHAWNWPLHHGAVKLKMGGFILKLAHFLPLGYGYF